VQLNRNQARFTFAFASDASLELVLAARDEAAPAFQRTASFNIFYSQAKGRYDPGQLEDLLREACERIAARDDGSLSLDSRKGLVQLARVRNERPPVV
jgi:hypothetical protein